MSEPSEADSLRRVCEAAKMGVDTAFVIGTDRDVSYMLMLIESMRGEGVLCDDDRVERSRGTPVVAFKGGGKLLLTTDSRHGKWWMGERKRLTGLNPECIRG